MNTVYMIMPVGADPAFGDKRRVALEVARASDCKLFFPLEDHLVFSTAASLAQMRRADLVIADLSKERPSCYYELGLAETVATNLALIAETGTRLHQVGRPEMVRFYNGIDEYRHLITELIPVDTTRVSSTSPESLHRF